MGVVFEARDPLIGRTVALKMIRLDALGTPAEREWLRERLFREARSAGALSHPGIVIIYDLGTSESLTYIAMEYVDGPTLEEVVSTAAPFQWKEALSIVRQAAEALDHAHAAGVVHRDVKPANIMLQRGRIVKITDFGIAKITSTQQITRTGMTMGTPSYMSPEQITAKALDGRADQFSLAVVAFQILTGVKPFLGESLPNLVHQIVYEDRPSASSANPALPGTVDAVLHRGLAKAPGDRYATCAAFVDALEAALGGSTGAPPAPMEPEPAKVREKQESEFTALFGEFIEQQRRQERAAKLAGVVEEVDRLLASGNVRAAAPVLASARKEFGDDPALLTLAIRWAEARRLLVEGAVLRAQEWLETRNFPAALNVLEIAGAEHGEPTEIVELRALVLEQQAASRREYEAGLENALAHANALLERNSPGDAAAYLESEAPRYGGEGEFTSLFASAIAAKKLAEERAAKLEASVSGVEKFLAVRDWQAARTALAAAQGEFPGEPALGPLQFRVEQVRQEALREPLAGSVSPQPEIAAAPEVSPWREPQPSYSPPNVVEKRRTIPKGLAVGASAAAAVFVGLLLVKVFSSSPRHAPTPQATKAEPAAPESKAPGPVRITQFYASPPNPAKGQKIQVCYGVENADQLTIEPALDRVWPSPSHCFETIPLGTVTYTLSAARGSERVTKSITVEVGQPGVKIVELSVDKVKIAPGELVQACYKVKNATRVALSPGVSLRHSNESGCVSDRPQKTTTYTLTARGAGGSVDSERVTVTVEAPQKAAARAVKTPVTPPVGRIIWTGNLAPGGDLIIDGGTASTGSLTGALPGVPVSVEVHPPDGLSVTASSDGRRLTIHNAADGKPQAIISIRWTVRP